MKYLSKGNWSYYIAVLTVVLTVLIRYIFEIYIDDLHPVVIVMIALVLITLPIFGIIYAFYIKRMWLRIVMLAMHLLIGCFAIRLSFLGIYFLLLVYLWDNVLSISNIF